MPSNISWLAFQYCHVKGLAQREWNSGFHR